MRKEKQSRAVIVSKQFRGNMDQGYIRLENETFSHFESL